MTDSYRPPVRSDSQCLTQMTRQRQGAEGFDKIGVGTDRPAKLLVFDLSAGGDEHDMHGRQRGLTLDALAELEAVHAARHHHVEYDTVGTLGQYLRVSDIRIAGLLQIEASAQGQPDHFANRGMIVDDQYFFHSAAPGS